MTFAAPPIPDDLPLGERLLTMRQVQERVPKSRITIYRWIREGRFPGNYRIGPNSVVWRESEIESFIAKHITSA